MDSACNLRRSAFTCLVNHIFQPIHIIFCNKRLFHSHQGASRNRVLEISLYCIAQHLSVFRDAHADHIANLSIIERRKCRRNIYFPLRRFLRIFTDSGQILIIDMIAALLRPCLHMQRPGYRRYFTASTVNLILPEYEDILRLHTLDLIQIRNLIKQPVPVFCLIYPIRDISISDSVYLLVFICIGIHPYG